MNIQKCFLFFFTILAAMPIVAQAQQYGVADITTAKSGAMKVQIQQFETTVKQLQDTITALNGQLQNQEAALNLVQTKVNDPAKGVDAINQKVEDLEQKSPEFAQVKTYCQTAGHSSCKLNCHTYSKHGYNGYNMSVHPTNYLKGRYNIVGIVKMISASMQYATGVNYDPNSTQDLHRITRLGGVDYDSGATSANCKANQIEYCTEASKTCVATKCSRKHPKTGTCLEKSCTKYVNTGCKVWAKKYVPTTCEAICGAVGFKK